MTTLYYQIFDLIKKIRILFSIEISIITTRGCWLSLAVFYKLIVLNSQLMQLKLKGT